MTTLPDAVVYYVGCDELHDAGCEYECCLSCHLEMTANAAPGFTRFVPIPGGIIRAVLCCHVMQRVRERPELLDAVKGRVLVNGGEHDGVR